ncbi:MAG: N-acetylmuramoyl-L-alanine amidase, partial [Myxococcales bacterium]|nr:N-acetylmuramoyl-L-alanine amidase [Myxococcales bacterium]
MRTTSLKKTLGLMMLALASVAVSLPTGALAQKKVCVNWSDQNNNSVSGGGTEDVYAGYIKDKLVATLSSSGFSVKTDGSFNNCNSNCNSWGANAFISIHSNAGGGHGTETWYGTYSGSQNWGSKVLAGLAAVLPYYNRGVKSSADGRYRVTRLAQQPSQLVETV